jgi:hypothetical protein
VDTLTLLLLLVAAVCFGLAAFGVGPGRVNLVAAGLLFWVLTALLPRLSEL